MVQFQWSFLIKILSSLHHGIDTVYCVCLGTVGRKRKASVNKNSSADKSELEGAAEAEESQQVSCVIYSHIYKRQMMEL